MFSVARILILSATVLGVGSAFAKDDGRLSVQEMKALLETEIETAPYATNAFLEPNEFHNFLHFDRQLLRPAPPKSAVLSVGTLRSFNLLGVLKRDALVAVDISDGVAELNRLIGAHTAESDRQKFIATLLGVESLPFAVETRQDFLAAVRLAERRYATQRTMDAATPAFRIRSVISRDYGSFPSWLKSLKRYAFSEQTWNAVFFAKEEHYAHVQKVTRAGNFWVVPGSLSGEKSMIQIGNDLTKRNLKVSEIDISNALDHIAAAEGQAGIRSLLRNLSSLPAHQDSRLLLTMMPGTVGALKLDRRGLPYADGWYYLIARLDRVSDLPRSIERAALYARLTHLHRNLNSCEAQLAHNL